MRPLTDITEELADLARAGTRKVELSFESPQGPRVELADGRVLINLCSNNYLGLANDPDIVHAAHAGLDRWGFGLSSVRFICGTQRLHQDLERRLSTFLGTEDSILFSSCFDANAGLFEVLLDERDVVISDALNHASIIDGIRLCKATRLRYPNGDIDELELLLRSVPDARRILIASDGVFSMDGSLVKLREIRRLADAHNALVMVDDSHAVGVYGEGGAGTPEHFGLHGKVDIITGTFGKALGGASGGYVSGRAEIIELLRQRARPYLFSNSLAPSVAAASLASIDKASEGRHLRARLHSNSARLRRGLTAAGFDLLPGNGPIVAVMFGDEHVAAGVSARLRDHGVHAPSFSYPVVPKGRARIRLQLSAAHTDADIDTAIGAFVAAARTTG